MRLYNEHIITNITVQDICEEADFNRSTFYAYYDNINDMYINIADDILKDLAALGPANRKLVFNSVKEYDENNRYKSEIIDPMHVILKYMKENADYVRPLLSFHGEPYFRNKWRKIVEDDIRKRLEYNEATFGKNEDYIIAYMSSGVVDITYKWLKSGKESVDEMSDIYMRFFFQSPFIRKK